MKTLPVPAFDAQFEPDDLADWRDHFVGYVVDFTVDEHADPVGATLDELLAAFEWDVEPTRADLDRWRGDLDTEVRDALPSAIAQASIQKAVTAYHEMRGKGRTVASIARALNLTPDALGRLVAEHSGEFDRKKTKALHAIRDEDRQHRAHRARSRALGRLQDKVEAALATADFTALPADKLADLLLRMAELSRADTPPALSVYVGGHHI